MSEEDEAELVEAIKGYLPQNTGGLTIDATNWQPLRVLQERYRDIPHDEILRLVRAEAAKSGINIG